MMLKSSDGASFFIMTYGAIKLTGVRECSRGGGGINLLRKRALVSVLDISLRTHVCASNFMWERAPRPPLIA